MRVRFRRIPFATEFHGLSIPLRVAVKRARIRATSDVSLAHLPFRVTSLPS